jgi:hypothetical protein
MVILRDMRERGFAILVVDVLNADPPVRPRSTDRMARRIWRMEQEAIRFSLRELGVPVVHWDGIGSLDLPLVWLEVMHRSRPWHTAVLGAALIAYLLATHRPSPTPPPGRSGRRYGYWPWARACSRSARAPGCCPRPDRARARRCCGWSRPAR